MKRFLFVAFMLMSLVLVQSGSANEVKQVHLEAPIKITYTLPAQGTFETVGFDVQQKESKKGHLSGFRYGRAERAVGMSLFQINGKMTREGRAIASTAEYPVYTDAIPGSVAITVTNAITFMFKVPFMDGTPLPVFNEDVMVSILRRGIITYTVDIKSDMYKPDAIIGQFKSIALAEGVQKSDLVRRGQLVKVTHILEKNIDCAVEVNAWHNGSKTTVTFQVPITTAAEGSNTVDAVPEIDAVIKKLTAIVND
jgi:hypothetical protein